MSERYRGCCVRALLTSKCVLSASIEGGLCVGKACAKANKDGEEKRATIK